MYKVIELEIDPTISGDTGVFEVAWVEYPAIEQELMYFGQQKFYKAPENVSAKACRAIKENEERGNPAATQVGKVRAQQLCQRDEISLETIKRMKSYLERAAEYYTGNYDDNGTISYDLWGGKPALEWVDGILKDLEMGTQDFAEVGPRGGIRESDKAPKSDTPNRNPQGEGTAKGDASSTRGAEVTQRVEEILQKKSDEFNEKYKDKLGYGVNLGMLKSVYQRGVGAYNTSHSPSVKSSEQWALARVNAFLYLVKNGRPENSKYTGDNDLLPGKHPKKVEMGTQDFVKPGPTESKDEFIGRCISYVLKEGKTPDQAAGQCYGMWENREFAATRVGFDWEVLKTPVGLKLFKNEMSRGSLPVLFIQGLPTQELIDFTRQYGIPSTAINMYDTRYEKIDLVRDMGLPRHYDLDFNVRRELGSIAIKFDYDTSALPSYENYPASGDTDSMLVEPELPSTLYEGCGCGDGYFQEDSLMFPGQVGIIDGHPTFETIADAENHSIYIGCVGHHTHTTVEGNQVYMACDKHPETDYSEYTTEDFEMKKHFDFLRETLSPQEFEAITNPLLRGFTESEIYSKNHSIPTNYFQYARVTNAEGMDRDFCMSIEGRYFRRAQIDTLRDTNVEFGHQRQPYSKWLYKGGPNCIHAWIKVVFQGRNKAVMGPAEGKAGIAPKNQPFNGYYSEETRQASRRAYAISQNMSSVSYMKDIECAFGDVCKPRFDNKSEQVFAAKEEERMIYTPLMIPNILIPRIDEVSKEKYYVKFTPETIKNIRDKFMAELRNRMTNYEHTDKKFEDVVMVETWIVQGEKDKAYELGFTQEQVPFGSWMGAYKVLDTEQGNYVWNNYIKPGKVKGASVEGNFILNFSQQKGDEYLLEQVINIINQITD